MWEHVSDRTRVALRTISGVISFLPPFGYWDWSWVVRISGKYLYLQSQFAGPQCPYLGCAYTRTLQGSEQLACSERFSDRCSGESQVWLGRQVFRLVPPGDSWCECAHGSYFGFSTSSPILLFVLESLFSYFPLIFLFPLTSVHACKILMS